MPPPPDDVDEDLDEAPAFDLKDRRFAGANTGPTIIDAVGVADDASDEAKAEAAEADADSKADATDDAAAAHAEALATLKGELQGKEARLQRTLGQYRDALEEFENTKARLRRDVQKDVAAGKRAILGELLEVLDNLERALQTASDDATSATSPLHQGVTMVRDQFLAKLEALGVRRLEALGKPFDAARYEAISTVPVTQAAQDNQVMGVVRDAYMLGDEVLRYGMVAVGKKA